MTNKMNNNSIYDTIVRIFFLFLIVVWCLLIILPFVHIILWGLIFGIALLPLHNWLTKVLKGRSKLASTIIVLVGLSIIIIPGVLFIDSIVEGVKEMRVAYQADSLSIPPPSEKVKTWPVLGNKVFELWSSLSSNLEDFIVKYKDQLKEIGKKVATGLLGTVSGIIQIIAALIIAGVLLVVSGTGEAVRQFFRKVAGDRGDEFADVAKATIGNVVKGVLGVALIQAFLIGLGFLLAGIPFAGLWTLIVLILAILQLPPTLIVLPIVAYMFSEMEILPAALWTIYLFLAGLSDNFLKPILLGKGAAVPMLVIFIGVVGGFMFAGFIGLFTGAIVMSIGYKLFIAWIDSSELNEKEDI